MMQNNKKTRLILASASPRRLQLLAQIAIVPDAVEPADIDESAKKRELPNHMVNRLAMDKARFVASRHPSSLVLAADTLVACGRRVLPKASDEKQARHCLQLLSGRRHRVYGAICVINANGVEHTRTVITAVTFKRLSAQEIDNYIACGEWRDKAGAYAIQGRAGAFVRRINGSYTNVVGLSLFETASLLKGVGYR